MLTSLTTAAVTDYLARQLQHFFPDGGDPDLRPVASPALERVEVCFAPIKLPMYRQGDQPYFNHLHSDHYAVFVYLASSVAFQRGELRLAAKLYGLNKALNGFMCMYDTVSCHRTSSSSTPWVCSSARRPTETTSSPSTT